MRGSGILTDEYAKHVADQSRFPPPLRKVASNTGGVGELQPRVKPRVPGQPKIINAEGVDQRASLKVDRLRVGEHLQCSTASEFSVPTTEPIVYDAVDACSR
jgi:hypothetical protein